MRFPNSALFAIPFVVLAGFLIYFSLPIEQVEIFNEPQRTGVESFGLGGHFKITVIAPDGTIKAYITSDNLIVTAGRQVTSDLLFGTTLVSGESATAMTNISLGTDSTAPAVDNTNCIAQVSNKRVGTVANISPTGANITASWVGQIHNGSGSTALREICLTDSSANSTGNMFARQTYAAVNVAEDDTVNAEWNLNFTDSDST